LLPFKNLLAGLILTSGDSAVHPDVVPIWRMLFFDNGIYDFDDADQFFFFLCREVKGGLFYHIGND
jgi:hypothetical protein